MRVTLIAALIPSSNAANRRFGGSESYFHSLGNRGRVGFSGGWYETVWAIRRYNGVRNFSAGLSTRCRLNCLGQCQAHAAPSYRARQIGRGAALSRSIEKRLVTFRNGTAAIRRR